VKRKNTPPAVLASLVVAGAVGGNMTAQPEVEQLPAPEPVVLPAETVEVPVRLEELHHTVDQSVRRELKMSDDTKNSELVKNYKLLAKTAKSLTEENAALRQENQRVVDLANQRAEPSEVQKYYEGLRLEGSR